MKTHGNRYLVLFTSLFAFGCSTAVVDLDNPDAQTIGVDASSGGTNVSSTNADAKTQQSVDSKSVSGADATSADTTKNADVAQKADAADTSDTKSGTHHDANTIDAGADVKSTADAGSSKDTAQNDVDAGSKDTGTSNTDVGGADACIKYWFCEDKDGDGYGNGSKCVLSCTKPIGYVSDSNDCNDANPDQTTAYLEVCDGKDNDCDGITDNVTDPAFLQTYYEDKDGDGFGNPNAPKKACSKPTGYVVDNTDCDDTSNLVRPGMLELCDGKDNDCNGVIDDGVKLVTYYVDEDNDGYGSDKDPTFPPTTLCDNGYQNVPSYYVSNKTDCNDKNASVHPGATEVCSDNIDNNCDGVVNEGCDTCDVVACNALAGTCEAGVCKTFCDTCAADSACEDTNKDGVGDTCTAIPSNMIQPYYKDLDNAMVVVFPSLPTNTSFDFQYLAYKSEKELGNKWTDDTQWFLQSNYYVMELFDIFDSSTVNTMGFNDPNVCGIQFNADISAPGTYQLNPASHWLCEGNGSTAHWYDSGTRFFRVKNAVLIEVTKYVERWSSPLGVDGGCDAKLPIKTCSK